MLTAQILQQRKKKQEFEQGMWFSSLAQWSYEPIKN